MWAPRARIVVFALLGAALALAVAGRVGAKVGPFDTTFTVRPSLHGYTLVQLAPLGTIELDTHNWPIALDVSVDEIGVDDAQRIANDPALVEQLGDEVASEVRSAVIALGLRSALVVVVGGALGALAARANWQSAVVGATTAGLLVVAVGSGTLATFNPDAVAEPRYTGLLTMAPRAVGDVESVIDRYGEYRVQLSELVGNVATLYLAGEGLQTFTPDAGTIRVLHVSDIHLNPQAFDLMHQVEDQFDIDAIVDTGDLTDWGTDPESRFVDEIGRLGVPYVYVRGNHDSRATQRAVADQSNAVVLDGEAETVAGLRFWGLGDPRYTPDKDAESVAASERDRAEAVAPEIAEGVVDAAPPDVDVLLVHDPRMARDAGGLVPLILAGHTHKAQQGKIDPVDDAEGSDEEGDEPDADGGATVPGPEGPDSDDDSADRPDESSETLLLVEGSTGGAGLRGLQGDEPNPLAASVLYFDADTRRLVAYDRLTVKGLGETGATIERHVVASDPRNPDDASPAEAPVRP